MTRITWRIKPFNPERGLWEGAGTCGAVAFEASARPYCPGGLRVESYTVHVYTGSGDPEIVSVPISDASGAAAALRRGVAIICDPLRAALTETCPK